MTETYANKMFYKWESEQYGDNSPLSDDDRLLWVKGYMYCAELFTTSLLGSV